MKCRTFHGPFRAIFFCMLFVLIFVHTSSSSSEFKLQVIPNWGYESDQAGVRLGWSAAGAGDVNGDGYDDAIVGAPLWDHSGVDLGLVLVFYGSASGLSTAFDFSMEGGLTNAQAGYSVAGAGDLDGDGYADFIVGTPHWQDSEVAEGAADVYMGSASGPAADWHAESNSANAYFGQAVAGAGDVNGDGYDDVIVGAPNFNPGALAAAGKAYAYLGSASGLGGAAAWTKTSAQAGAYLGTCVASAGDVNGDTYDDVIVSAPYWTDLHTNEGAVMVFYGGAGGLSASADWTAYGGLADSRFGLSVAGRCDVNGDGFSDIFVGAPKETVQETDEGRVFAYYGSAAGPSAVADWWYTANQTGAALGGAVACAGDVNDDGYDDVIVGSSGYSGLVAQEGRAYVFLGSASGLLDEPDWIVGSAQADAQLGWSVAGAGDVNGDGFADVLVSAPWYDKDQTDEGAVWAYYGEPSDDDSADDSADDTADDDSADDDDSDDSTDDSANDDTDDDVHASGDDDDDDGCCGC